ncbi:hypothetical protein LTSEMIN_3118 [Salmonella enterica subsp. enterica serovar Minnesota str. A4-603]|nr:hypothetical protein LTSEMIN_3118 [Salmonella enterica subsp. enterica serovar Minnesota str. A4-603]
MYWHQLFRNQFGRIEQIKIEFKLFKFILFGNEIEFKFILFGNEL